MYEQGKRMATVAVIVAGLTMGGSVAARADDAPSAGEISEAVSDHTYQGSMLAPGSGFAEYYAPDGTIRGDGYSGNWRTEDGVMCFQYGDNPEKCWEIQLQGPSMVMLKDGAVDGNGILVPGNENGF